MSRQTGRLALTPADPLLAPERDRICSELTALGLLGGAIHNVFDAFHTGQRFPMLVTFAGCSVQLETAAGGKGELPPIHIRIDGPSPGPRLWHGRNTRPPRCPNCRALLRDWRARIRAGTEFLACPQCSTCQAPTAWDWRGYGGAGHLFVCIEGVFPGEAMPTHALMQSLRDLEGYDWRHFSIQDD